MKCAICQIAYELKTAYELLSHSKSFEVIRSYLTLNIIVTLKCGLEVKVIENSTTRKHRRVRSY